MKILLLLFYILYCGIGLAQDQELEQDSIASKGYIAQANHLLEQKGDFPIAEGELRKAIAKNPSGTIAPFNLGNAYYGSQKFGEATDRYKQTAALTDSKTRKHSAYHNLGNSLMEQKQYAKAVAAYKNALRNKPSDNETRYNLALAKKKKEEQQKKEEKNKKNKKEDDKNKKSDQNNEKNKNKNKDKDKDKKENKEKSEKDKNKKGEDEKKKEKQSNEKKDQTDQNRDPKKTDKGNKPEDKKPAKSIPGQLSPQQIKNLLEAMRNEEKKVQRKVNLEKRKGTKKRSEKDW